MPFYLGVPVFIQAQEDPVLQQIRRRGVLEKSKRPGYGGTCGPGGICGSR
jgi:hypothetical protein